MVNQALAGFSGFLSVLNRGLAWLDFGVHYISGYLFYYLLGGLAPQFHTRPSKRKDGRPYTPAVVVTGASQGIGLATSLFLASKGYHVFAAVKDDQELEAIKQEIKSRDLRPEIGFIHPMIMDVLSQSSISKAVEHITKSVDKDKPLIGVVNNAGLCMISPMELTPEKAVRDLFELDFWAYYRVIVAFMPLMKKYQGRFVNIGSVGGFVNPPMWASYCAAKAAIEGMTRSWRFELQPFGVGMTCVRPGWTRTHGIGPKISEAWESYFDNELGEVAGVDSMGHLVDCDKEAGVKEKEVYGQMMRRWYKMIMAAADGAAETAEEVAKTVHDAMTDPFLQPYYTVGYDALLGQTVRDLAPESWYEVGMTRMFR